jgi:hypothetical protein
MSPRALLVALLLACVAAAADAQSNKNIVHACELAISGGRQPWIVVVNNADVYA